MNISIFGNNVIVRIEDWFPNLLIVCSTIAGIWWKEHTIPEKKVRWIPDEVIKFPWDYILFQRRFIDLQDWFLSFSPKEFIELLEKVYKITGMKSRINYLDFIRALAIIFVLISHLDTYVIKNKLLLNFEPYFGNFGVGLFIFLSGYVLFLNHSSFHSTQEILIFYKKRMVRIFPLYLIALMVFFMFFGLLSPIFSYNPSMDFGINNLIIHILGLQILLSPEYATPILTLYFIGLLVIFSLLYPLLIRFSKNCKEFLVLSLVPFIIFLLFRFFFNIIDDYFFQYYFVFIFGVLFCYIFSTNNKKRLKLLIVIPVILVCSLILSVRNMVSNNLGFDTIISYAIFDIVIISFCLIQFEISKMFIDDLSPQTQKLIANIAFCSYAIFLFHRPIMTFFYGSALLLGLPEIIRDLIIIFVAIPAVFIISYYIQLSEEKIFRKG